MHELSIALGIVDIAEKEAKKAGVSAFKKIDLEIGTLSGIILDSLDFAWNSAVNGTCLENSVRCIERIDAVAKCLDCDLEFNTLSLYEQCPKCGGFATALIKGKELRIKSLEY